MTSHSCRPSSLGLLLLVLFGCLGVIGCGGLPPVPVSVRPEAAARVSSTHIRAHVPQNELEVKYFGLDGSGIVPALVTDSRRSDAEAYTKSFPNTDFRRRFLEGTLPVLQATEWLKAREPMIAMGSLLPEPIIGANDSVLVLKAEYFISQNCRVFQVRTTIDFALRSSGEDARARNEVHYHSAAVGPNPGAEAVALWTANDGAAYKRAIDESVFESMKMLRHALAHMSGSPPKPLRQAAIRVQLIHGALGFGTEDIAKWDVNVAIFQETKDRLVLQILDREGWVGSFHSFAREDIDFGGSEPANPSTD